MTLSVSIIAAVIPTRIVSTTTSLETAICACYLNRILHVISWLIVLGMFFSSVSCQVTFNNSIDGTKATPIDTTLTASSPVTTGTPDHPVFVPAAAGAIYEWTVVGGTITGGQNTSMITYTAGAVGTATVSCKVTVGNSFAIGTKTITVAPIDATLTAASPVTTGTANHPVFLPATAGATYEWTVVGGAITAGQGTPMIVYTAGAVGTATVNCQVTIGDTSTPGIGTKLISIVAAPVATITADSQVAAATTGHQASVPSQFDSTFTWIITNGTITAGQGTNAITYTAGAVGITTLSCTVKNAAGTVSNGTMSVAITVVSAEGVFTTTGSMSAARISPSATLLPDGKVLVAGGTRDDSPYLASAELYDPTTGTFTATGSMSVERAGHTATLLPNGKVLIVGGGQASAELYDPSTETFTATGSMSEVRGGNTATLLPNGRVLVAGGSSASAELYDPSTGIFTATGSMSEARFLHTAALLNSGKVLVAGGDGHNGSSWFTLSSAEIYDPATEVWTPTDSLEKAHGSHTMTLLPNGKVLLVAGGNAIDGYLSSAEIYDPATKTWTPTGNMTTPRNCQTATLLSSGKVLVAAGFYSSVAINSAEIYDPAKGTWTPTGSLAIPRGRHTATLLSDGKVLLAGGDYRTGSEPFSLLSAELYIP